MAGGLPFWAILSLPVLFAAGMSLFDTIDGCFMNFAYDWAFSKPVRKVFYNLTITGLSVVVAFFIGTIEVLGLIGSELNLDEPLLELFADFNINTAGFFIVGVFVPPGSWPWCLALRQRRGQVGGSTVPSRAGGGGDLQGSHNGLKNAADPSCFRVDETSPEKVLPRTSYVGRRPRTVKSSRDAPDAVGSVLRPKRRAASSIASARRSPRLVIAGPKTGL